MKNKAILGIDRGSKYIGIAYLLKGQSVPMPIGYLINDKNCLFDIADLCIRYNTEKIVIGYPQKQKDIQEKIDKFIENLSLVINPEIRFEKVDEDYSSVQSGELVSNFKKNIAEDTVSAMIILDRWFKFNNK